MTNDPQLIQKYIEEETGVVVSKMLLSFIMNPQKLDGLNNKALKDIVIEYAPIFKRFRGMLDGPSEQTVLVTFDLFLMCRIANKPELNAILDLRL